MVILLFNPEWVLLGLIWEEANGQLGMQSKFKCWSNLSEFWVAQEFLQSPPSSYLVKVFSWYQMPTAFTLLLSWPRGPPPGVPYFSLSDLSPIQNIPSASLTWSLCSCFGVAQLRGHCSHWSPWEWCWSVHPGGGCRGPWALGVAFLSYLHVHLGLFHGIGPTEGVLGFLADCEGSIFWTGPVFSEAAGFCSSEVYGLRSKPVSLNPDHHLKLCNRDKRPALCVSVSFSGKWG